MDLFHDRGRSQWIRLSTLVFLRWIAVAGQSIVIVVSVLWFQLDLALDLIIAAIGALILANLLLSALYPRDQKMQPAQAVGFLMFDVVQLAALLAVTGGFSNPFVMIMLAPITISATTLAFRGMLAISAVAVLLMSLMWNAHIPLRFADGSELELPELFRFGHWVATLISVVFLSLYARRIMSEIYAMDDALTATHHALAREQKLTDLGGVVAAAAHELGTPLATITLTAAEMEDLLDKSPDLAEDARLIRTQADRCRDILREMGRSGRDDLLMRSAPVTAIVEDAAEPHMNRGKTVQITCDGDSAPPEIPRAPEIIHGLRNLIQNAVDFAATRVEIRISWDHQTITLRIHDDGPGFPPGLFNRLGDPMHLRHRADTRKGYEGMGLGLFIAKTLLERQAGRLMLSNAKGAIAEVIWLRAEIETDQSRQALGNNPMLDA